MLEGPITIGYGLICHQFVHLVCSFYFFDTVLYETFLSSDLGFVLCLGFFSPIALTSLNMNVVALWLEHTLPTSASLHLSYALIF